MYKCTMSVRKVKKKGDPLSLPWFSLVIMYHELSDTTDKGTITQDIYYAKTTMQPTKKLYHKKETSPFITSPPIYESRDAS